MIGISISTFNRPQYLAECLETVKRAKYPKKTCIIIVDDCSTDETTKKMIQDFSTVEIPNVKIMVLMKKENKRIPDSILQAFDYFFKNLNCEFVMNLDSDALVKTNYVYVLTDLHERFPDTIVTGFNCLTRNANGSERHKVISNGIGYNTKASVGGINMLMNKEVYEKYCRPALLVSIEQGGNWDHMSCLNLQKEGKSVACSVPSVIQHIGFNSSMNHREKPDVADDFKELYLPNVTVIGVDCLKIERLIKAANDTEKNIHFNDVRLLSNIAHRDKRTHKIEPIRSKEKYSEFMIKRLNEYFSTDFVLVIQYDGYVMNYKAWDEEFLKYDYIGATWWYEDGMNVGNGGFSLRSKKLQEILATDPHITVCHPEDDSICRRYRPYLEQKYGIKFAPEEVAKKFSIEGYKQDDKYYEGQFGFHGKAVVFTPRPVVEKKQELIKDEHNPDTIIINQFFGLGDVLFCIEIARRYIKKGHKVVWALEPHYLNIAKHFPEIQFVDKNLLHIDYTSRKEINGNGFKVIPLRFSDSIMKVHYSECMKSKYMMFNLDWKMWRGLENSWIRFSGNENKLFDVLGIKPDEMYCVVNMQFRNGGKGHRHINISTDKKIVEMRMIPGFSLLDWAKVLEYASEIHTVSTSIIYLLEMINSRATNIHIYVRRPDEKNHDNYSYILTHRHNYILE